MELGARRRVDHGIDSPSVQMLKWNLPLAARLPDKSGCINKNPITREGGSGEKYVVDTRVYVI